MALGSQLCELPDAEAIRRLMSKNLRKDALERIFASPVSATVQWRDVQSLLAALGASVEERKGSRVAVLLNEKVAVFHRPHPGPNMDKGAVEDLRKLVESAEIEP